MSHLDLWHVVPAQGELWLSQLEAGLNYSVRHRAHLSDRCLEKPLRPTWHQLRVNESAAAPWKDKQIYV